MGRIDHVVHAVTDLDEAAAAYRGCGFVVTARADHPFGTSNRLVLFGRPGEGSYLELVAVTRPDAIPPPTSQRPSFGANVRDFLTTGPGGAMVVLASDDADAQRRRLAARGLDPYPAFSFSRTAPQPDGSSAEVAFDLVFVAPLGPECGVFFCHHRTPERIWHEEFRRHPNGASSLREVVLVGGDDLAPRLTDLTESTPTPNAGGLTFPLEGATLSLVDLEGFADRFGGAAPPRRHPPFIAAVVVEGTEAQAVNVAGLQVEVTPR